MPEHKYTNKLIQEKSPYLLQHAHNPVNWYPWGNEAFEKAIKEDMPIFLSIGYSTCHWCHVMEKESFEDEKVAEILNEKFISIKVDREERPDIDSFYMDACVALTNAGGWPLSCFLSHDRVPFYTGTYIPKNDSPYGAGLITLLNRISKLWSNDRDDLTKYSDTLIRHLNVIDDDFEIPPNATSSALQTLSSRFDAKFGGFSIAPKFPSFSTLLFLSRYYFETKDEQAKKMYKKTLDSMYQGGIFDHVGGGFCRYSTDDKWLVPHFEKMMTDNALHIMIYSEAAILLGKEYGDISRRITEFCIREMLDENGGFYTATDADSDGVEGKYYIFAPDEIIGVLGEDAGRRYCKMYDITAEGNFEGKNIPNLIGKRLNKDDNTFAKACNKKLLEYRNLRIQPFKDDKVLTHVNGLMIAALSVQGRILRDKSIISVAENCSEFISNSLFKNGRLMARWRKGEAGIPASSDDYASFIWGLIELYESTLKPKWLQLAITLTQDMDNLFWDHDSGGYYLAGKDMDELPIRQKNFLDGALPSGNGIMAMNLLRLSRICAEIKYDEQSQAIIRRTAAVMKAYPTAACMMLSSMVYLKNEGTEVVLINGEGFDELLHAIPALPFIAFSAYGEGYEDALNFAPHLEVYRSIGGKAAAYICKGGACISPVTSAEDIVKFFDEQK